MKDILPYAPLLTCAAVIVSAYLLHRRFKDSKLSKDSEWRGGVDVDRQTFKDFMAEIREKIIEIFDRLPPSPVAGKSPVKLTEFGEKISVTISAKDWASSLAPILLPKVVGKTEFDVYEFCGQYIDTELEPDFRRQVAETAYEIATTDDNVLTVLRVELRDALLAEQAKQ